MIQMDSNILDLEKMLDEMGKSAADLSDLWPEIGKWWQARQVTVFMTGNRGAWPMRSPNTDPGGRGLMIRTGALMRSVSSPKPIFANSSTARFGAKGGKTFYGSFHQKGEGVVKREVVPPLIATEIEEVIDIIKEYLMEAAK